MSILAILIATSLEMGFAFPGGGLEKEVNIGKYLFIEQRLVRVESFDISSYVRLSRFPSITTALSVYDMNAGVNIHLPMGFLKARGALGLGLGRLSSSRDIFRLELCPLIRKPIYGKNHLSLSLSFPVFFLKNTVMYSVNPGISVSL